jgi:hypothetical protein
VTAKATSAGRVRTARPRLPRAFWHALFATCGVVLVCAVIVGWSALSYRDADRQLAALTLRAVGQVTGGSGSTADVAWKTSAGHEMHAVVALSGAVPPAGTRTQIAFDPGDPADAIIPGARLLADADQARGGLIFAVLVGVLVLALDALWLLRRLRRRPGQPVTVRRIRVQRRLLSRSWLETEPVADTPQRWIPVYWDPVLAELPAPVQVTVHGERLVTIEARGVRLYPSGRVVTTEPVGRRTDSPSRPDEYALAKARSAGVLRQLRVDAALVVPAPLIGLFWAYLAQGGVSSWAGATVLCATLALWYAAIRGSDPT